MPLLNASSMSTTTALCWTKNQDNLHQFQCGQDKRNGVLDGASVPLSNFIVSFGRSAAICGLLYYSAYVAPGKPALYVNEFEVLISDDNNLYSSIGTFKPDNIFSNAYSILQFVNRITTRYLKIIVVSEGTNSIAMHMNFRLLQNCGACPAGLFGCSNTTTGTASCIKPPQNTCSPGRYRATVSGFSTCLACPAGTYNAGSGGIGVDSCSKCPRGRYSEVAGAVSATACQECPFGTSHRIFGASSPQSCQNCACT